MILALGLLTMAGALLRFGPVTLARLTASDRRPLASLAAWQLAGWSVVVGVALAAALLASPSLAAAGRLPAGLESCLAAVHDLGNPADSMLVRALGAGVVAGVVLRLLACAALTGVANRHRRGRHRLLLSLVGRPDTGLGAHVVPDDTAVVYCLPGRGGCVVFTSAALERLSGRQRAAVLEHERAHLRGHHGLLVGSSGLLARAFPRIRLFTQIREQTSRLVEMRADDVAVRGHGARPVVEALLALADVRNSGTVLAANGVATAARVERLLGQTGFEGPSILRCVGRVCAAVIAIGVIAATPVLLAIAGHAILCLL